MTTSGEGAREDALLLSEAVDSPTDQAERTEWPWAQQKQTKTCKKSRSRLSKPCRVAVHPLSEAAPAAPRCFMEANHNH